MRPDVSIIIPIHNAQNCMERAIASCLDQKKVEVEIILVENGSADGSLQLARKYENLYQNIRVFSLEQAGVSFARNIGLEHAKGIYVGFVDADDYVENNMYSSLLKGMSGKRNSVAMCEYFIEKGKNRHVFTKDLEKIGPDRDAIKRALIGGQKESPQIMGSVWRLLIPLHMIKANHLKFDEKLSIGEDFFFVLELMDHVEEVVLIYEPLYHYNICEGSVSTWICDVTWEKYKVFFMKLLQSDLYISGDSIQRKRIENKVIGLSEWLLQGFLRRHIPYKCRKKEVEDKLIDLLGLMSEDRLKENLFYKYLLDKSFFRVYLYYGILRNWKQRIGKFAGRILSLQ